MIRDLFSMFRGDMSVLDVMISLFATLFVVFCTLPIHEYAHARVATWLGDDTPRLMGRLTINPAKHIDPIGALMILIVGFGYAKPVQVNMRNFKNPRGGMAITALAGPIANLLMSFVFMLLYYILQIVKFRTGSVVAVSIMSFLTFAAYINVSLAVFNLLPVPPLDGSRLATLLIPPKYYYQIMQYERYIMIGLLVLLFTGILTRPLGYLASFVFTGISFLSSSIIGLFV